MQVYVQIVTKYVLYFMDPLLDEEGRVICVVCLLACC